MSTTPQTPDAGSIEITIGSTPHCLPAVRAAVSAMAVCEGFSDSDAHAVAWALDEALANVIKHGYGEANRGAIRLVMSPTRSDDDRPGLRIAVRDYGRQVDPACIKSRDLDDIRPGGLGVHIIKSVMDLVDYCPAENCGMMLTMTKFVSRADATQPEKAKA